MTPERRISHFKLVNCRSVEGQKWETAILEKSDRLTGFSGILVVRRDQIPCQIYVTNREMISQELVIANCPNHISKILTRFSDNPDEGITIEEEADWWCEVENRQLKLERRLHDDWTKYKKLSAPDRAAYFAKAFREIVGLKIIPQKTEN